MSSNQLPSKTPWMDASIYLVACNLMSSNQQKPFCAAVNLCIGFLELDHFQLFFLRVDGFFMNWGKLGFNLLATPIFTEYLL